ncbi:MAG TPA: histidine kinase dimerization/phospho-acceptor domain-containing protein, partial [Pseudomonadales bacterium]|nr:histidine kinase dimerization/phospho-acceptor domain-containing protein [Pseudomonadales bacterium]
MSRSLFFKIFLWFWSVVFIAMVVAVLTNNWLKKDYSRSATQQEIMQLVSMIEQERANIAEGRKLWRKTDPGWNLIAVPQDLLSHLPQALEDFTEQADRSGKVLYGQQGGWLLIGPLQHQGYLYLAASHAQWFTVFEAQDRVLVLLVALSVVTLLCLVLVWNLTRPIRQLQLAVRQLALGNFDTTELRQVKSREDEAGMLAGEMVNMAVALKRLLTSQHQLLRDVSHELRSPLTRLQIALAIARKKDPQGNLEVEHNRIERAVGQINNLISQILDLARLQQDELQL